MPKTLLLADDSVTIQRVIELTFAHEDVRVVSVGDGRSAIQWIDNEKPDIVVADIGVPDVDGYEIVAHVKKSKTQSATPVLLLAGAFEPVDDAKVRASGCDGLLVKPFEPQQLIARVKELLHMAPRPSPIYRERMGMADTPAGGGTAASSGSAAALATAPQTHTLTPEPLETLEPPASPIWDFPLGGAARQAAQPSPVTGKVSLANAFSALLAAEQSRPTAAAYAAAPPDIPEAAIESAVKKVLDRMTGDAVRRVVLETAERLIKDEIDKIKATPE
jgi:DNA-binding response OmpR family regulator